MTSKNNVSNSIKMNNVETKSYTDSLISSVKEKVSGNLKMYLLVAIPVIVFLVYLLYQYNFGNRSSKVIANMGYKNIIKVNPLPQCYQVDIKEQYKLCDYYISSSFMTPCVGNQHYDYVSNDMIIEVIQSGARYIQIPICESDVSSQSLPVVATAVYGQRVITSLNTLELKSVFKNIRNNAFKVNNKTLNYPLIVHLVLNTTNPFTLGAIADNIDEIFSDVLIDKSKYESFPLFLEKICNLSGKIILFATPEYIGSKLEPYIISTSKLFELNHFSELGSLVSSSDTAYTNSYNQKLSTKQQTKSNQLFKTKYPSIDYIVSNSDSIGKTILQDNDILNNLTCFNKVGMTVVKPHYPVDVLSSNYDFAESFYYGCQFVAMNFQINDINMKNYIDVFKESSFRLKPSSMRFTEQEEPITNLLSVYEAVINSNDSVLNDFYYKYNNLLISFESYSLPKTFLTQIENNLRFNLGTNQIKDKFGNITYKLGINQCFIPRKSKIGTSNNISIYLESAAIPGLFITLNTNTFNLQQLSSNKKTLMNQAFYIEKPKATDNEEGGIGGIENKEQMISMKITDDNNPLYLSFENKIVKAYPDSPQIQAHNNMSFYINSVKFNIVIKIITILGGTFKTMGGNIIGVLENNTNDGTSYIVVPSNSKMNNLGGNNFDIFKNQFMLQNKTKKTFVINDSETGFLYDREINQNANGIFSIVPKNGYYTIVNTNNKELAVYNTNLIKFIDNKYIVSNENLFKLDISYDLL